MATENVKLFVEKVKSDSDLAEKLRNLKESDHPQQLTELVRIANEQGYDFTEAEYEECLREELSEEQLDKVAGGFYVDFSW